MNSKRLMGYQCDTNVISPNDNTDKRVVSTHARKEERKQHASERRDDGHRKVTLRNAQDRETRQELAYFATKGW